MNVLILSASTGGGHMKAAETIKKYINENDKDAKVQLIDTIEYINPVVNKIISGGYVFLVRNINFLYRIFYNDTDRKSFISKFITEVLKLLSKKILLLINNFEADVIISVHPFATEIISILREKSKIQIPHISIMTDYAAHNTWIKKKVDGYCIACEDMIEEMVKRGVPKERIYPFGIPVAQEFYDKSTEEYNLLKELKHKSVKTILIMAGSFGVNNIEKIYKALLTIEEEFQIIIITGNNKVLFNKISRIKQNMKPTQIIKYTDEVYNYMHVADILITKPGGLTISEALAANLPMVIFDAIPGQEEENAKFLLNHGMAVSIGRGKDCVKVIREVLDENKKIEVLKTNCTNFHKEESCKNILQLIRGIIKNKEMKF